MAWNNTKEDFHRMMLVNFDLFGFDLPGINDATEELLIKHFEKGLFIVLNFIDDGQPLSETMYELVRSEKEHINCYKYE